jgi:hypothetical protein
MSSPGREETSDLPWIRTVSPYVTHSPEVQRNRKVTAETRAEAAFLMLRGSHQGRRFAWGHNGRPRLGLIPETSEDSLGR